MKDSDWSGEHILRVGNDVHDVHNVHVRTTSTKTTKSNTTYNTTYNTAYNTAYNTTNLSDGKSAERADGALVMPQIEPQLTSFIFPDMRALYNIGIESYKDVYYDEITVQGFEIYIVEQWIAERKLSAVISSYTGNTQDVISAVRVVLNRDPHFWPHRFKRYYEELLPFTQPKFISKGCIFVTNLSAMSSKLSLLHVECGDLRSVWHDFKTNFDLKKLHCTGRSALLLSAPASSAMNKFSQLFKIPIKDVVTTDQVGSQQYQDPTTEAHLLSHKRSLEDPFSGRGDEEHHPLTFSKRTMQERTPPAASLWKTKKAHDLPGFYSPVVEMVTLIQISLSYFNLFKGKDKNIVDGLLSEGTKSAIEQWWLVFGRIYFGVEKPRNEGTLGPTTVASMLSLVLSCFYKLILVDCMPAKDPFDEQDFRQGVSNFQKKYSTTTKENEGFLDPPTVEKLFQEEARLTKNEFKKLTKTVKCKFQDIGGKGNVVQLANNVLSTDMDNFVKHIQCGSLGLLWKNKGRPRRKDVRRICKKEFCGYSYKNGDPEKQLDEETERCNNLNEKLRLAHEEENKKKTSEMFGNYMIDIPIIGNDLHMGDPVSSKPWRTSDAGSSEKEDDVMSKGPSAVSLSSMYCNYDKHHYESGLNTNQLYHSEFYRRGSSSNLQTLREESETGVLECTEVLYRSISCSDIQQQIERWTLPFDPSVVRLARDLKKIQRETKAEAQIEDMQHGYYSIMTKKTCYMEEKRMQDLLKVSGDLFYKYVHAARAFQNKYDGIEIKQNFLLNDMRELNSLCSKLKYDVRILDLRVRDVEEAIQQFQRKLDTVRNTMNIGHSTIHIDTADVGTKEEFDQYIIDRYNKAHPCYQSYCLKVISKDFYNNLKNDISGWVSWLFDGMFQKDK
ncbi:related to Protein STB2 [Nakaseomyces glabratus]|nr:hypothetical protein J6894_01496 [Nakaseomyces glabratus]QNG13580.1 uncharacterized protein GWK60_F05885 [Nakaseomyces glabratus]SCV16813.1 related to Protein STB2 [Nakaseomyces glabratus]SLM16612.1 related to Protein STB2 [Nakaseomyces glabratus]